MSGEFCMALALYDRHVAIEGMLRFDNPTVNRLAQRVRIVADETIAVRSCRLKIRTTDGRTIAGKVGAPVGRPSFEERARARPRAATGVGNRRGHRRSLHRAHRRARTRGERCTTSVMLGAQLILTVGLLMPLRIST
jgi:2-methylcitrate dehydratase PrpD